MATYTVAFYEIDREYGGGEEGGWWYDTGTLKRLFKVCKSESAAYAAADRANRLLDHLQRRGRSVSSILYAGGRFHAQVYEGSPPDHYPESRPYYE